MRCSFTRVGENFIFYNESRLIINVFLHQFFIQLNKFESEEIDNKLDISGHSMQKWYLLLFFFYLIIVGLLKKILNHSFKSG